MNINTNLLEEIGLKKAIKKKEVPKNQMDFLEKVEKEKLKREEKEKLKLLEKLESQVLKIKKTTNKQNVLNSTTSSNLSIHKRLIDNIPKNDKILPKQNIQDDKMKKFDIKLLDDSEFRKVNIKKEKIEINCDDTEKNNQNYKDGADNTFNNEDSEVGKKKNLNNKFYITDQQNKGENNTKTQDEIIEAEFIKGLSKERLKFFRFKAPQIYDFLHSIMLIRYIEIFIEDGFEDIESILGKEFENIYILTHKLDSWLIF